MKNAKFIVYNIFYIVFRLQNKIKKERIIKITVTQFSGINFTLLK